MGEKREWQGTDVGGHRTTGDLALRVMGHRWRTQPRQDLEIETDLVASAKLHTTTTTQGQGEVGEAREWRALMLAVTEPQVIQQRRERVTNGGHSPVRTQRLRLIWLPVPQETSSPAATLTPLSMDPPPQHHTSDYPYSSANAAPTMTPTMAERAHPCNNNRGQPRTAKDNPEKTPRAPRTQGDEPTHTLQWRGGGGAADSSLSPTAGTHTKGN